MSTPTGTAADLLYTDVEDALRDSVRALLGDRCPPSVPAAAYDDDRDAEPGLWRALAVDLGLAGLLVPEEHGGAGATAREAAVVLEELGRSVAPVPFLTSAVLATVALTEAGDARLLPRLAAGEQTAALAVPLSATAGTAHTAVRRDGDGLHGRVTSVADAQRADVLLVPVDTDEGLALHAVDTTAPGVTVSPVVSLDMTRPVADVDLAAAASVPVAGPDRAASALRAALTAGAALLSSEQLGVAEWCLDSTLAHVKQRTQFGRAVGSFQALKHRLADLWLEIGSARAAARYAAATLAGGGGLPVAASLAQAYCSEVAVHAAEECVQLHGGIGMTWEHPAHLYLKRAKADEIALGTPGRHRARLGGLVDLPAAG